MSNPRRFTQTVEIAGRPCQARPAGIAQNASPPRRRSAACVRISSEDCIPGAWDAPTEDTFSIYGSGLPPIQSVRPVVISVNMIRLNKERKMVCSIILMAIWLDYS